MKVFTIVNVFFIFLRFPEYRQFLQFLYLLPFYPFIFSLVKNEEKLFCPWALPQLTLHLANCLADRQSAARKKSVRPICGQQRESFIENINISKGLKKVLERMCMNLNKIYISIFLRTKLFLCVNNNCGWGFGFFCCKKYYTLIIYMCY